MTSVLGPNLGAARNLRTRYMSAAALNAAVPPHLLATKVGMCHL